MCISYYTMSCDIPLVLWGTCDLWGNRIVSGEKVGGGFHALGRSLRLSYFVCFFFTLFGSSVCMHNVCVFCFFFRVC